jgi:hypothetical protein
MRKITFYGKIARYNQGKVILELHDRDEMLQRTWESMSDNPTGIVPIRMVIYEDDKGKDSGDFGYYWAVVVPEIQKAMNDLGNQYDKNEVHEKLKELFIRPNKAGIRSTSKMTKSQFVLYIENCCKFAAEFLGIEVKRKTQGQHFPSQET